MPSLTEEYSGGQYAQGLALAELQKLSPIMADFLDKQTKTLVKMSRRALEATLSAALHTMLGSFAQAGISFAGAGAGGFSAKSGGSLLDTSIKDTELFTNKRSTFDALLKDPKPATLKFNNNGTAPLQGDNLKNGETGIDVTAEKEHADLKKLTEMRQAKIDRKNLITDYHQEQANKKQEHDNNTSFYRAFQSGAEAVGLQPVNGWQQKSQQEQQGMQNIANQSSQQAETAKEQGVSAWIALIAALSDIQGYTAGMTRS